MEDKAVSSNQEETQTVLNEHRGSSGGGEGGMVLSKTRSMSNLFFIYMEHAGTSVSDT